MRFSFLNDEGDYLSKNDLPDSKPKVKNLEVNL